MEPERFLELTRFWVQRVLVPILVLIGAGGNIVTVMVLTRRRMRCSTNIYLTALAVTDLIYLLLILILSFEHYPNINDIRYELYWRFYGINHWFTDAASSTSIWLTVSFTVERYIAVCHPIRGKVLCTETRAKRVIAVVCIICILATASTSFEYQLTTSQNCIQKSCTESKQQQKEVDTLQSKQNDTNVTINDNIKKLYNTTENSTNIYDNIEKYYNITDEFTDNINDNITKIEMNTNNTENISTTNKNIIVTTTEKPKLSTTVESYADWSEIILDTNYFQNHNPATKDTFSPFNTMLNEMADVSINILPLCDNTSLIYNDTGQNCSESSLCIDQNTNLTVCFNTNITLKYLEDYDIISDCCINNTIIKTEPTMLGRNGTYRTIFYWFSSVSFAFLPLILIATINCFLVNAVRKSQKERKKMTKSQENSSQSQENRMTVILISVVILFLICQTPTACLLIYTSVYPSNDAYSDNIVRGLGNVFNLLVSINAACNFLLYCALSEKYRRTFKALFCEKKLTRRDTFAISGKFASRVTSSTSNGPGCKRNASAYLPRTVETQSLTSIPRAKSMINRPVARKRDNIKV